MSVKAHAMHNVALEISKKNAMKDVLSERPVKNTRPQERPSSSRRRPTQTNTNVLVIISPVCGVSTGKSVPEWLSKEMKEMSLKAS